MHVIGDLVIYGDNAGYVAALDARTGQFQWRQKVGGDFGDFISDLTVDNGLVFAVSQPSVVEAFDLASGKRLWSFDGVRHGIDSRSVQLGVYEDQLYILDPQTHVANQRTGQIEYVLDKDLYGTQWEDGRFFTSDSVLDADTLTLELPLIPPSRKVLYGNCEQYRLPYTVLDNTIYGIGYCGGVYAVDAANARILWEYRPELDGESPTAAFGEYLYVLFRNGDIHAIDLQSGENRGVLDTSPRLANAIVGSLSSRGVTTNGEVLIVTFNDGTVLALGEADP
jgi:outer membrane protein assembly factor BamB